MSDRHTVWIDVERCTGCGACVEVCPVEAIALANERAHIDPEICTGCDACIDACPEGAIQPVVEGELILAPQRPVPTVHQPSPLAETAATTAAPAVSVHQPSPLAETAGAAVVATGVGLLAKAAGALIRAIGQWLMRPSAQAGSSAAKAPSLAQRRGEAGQGRQARHRRRGR